MLAVLIATPEHWRAQMVVDAQAAGKGVYVETPLYRTPEGGVRLVLVCNTRVGPKNPAVIHELRKGGRRRCPITTRSVWTSWCDRGEREKGGCG